MPSPPEEDNQPRRESVTASPPEQDSQPKRESGQASDTTTDARSAQPISHPPQAAPPPNANPPVMGYPGYAYQGYPNGQQYNQYSYAQAPPGMYYASPYQTVGPMHNPAVGFFRGILAGLIFLVFLFFLSSLIGWFVLQPKVPIFYVTHFSVSAFNITGPIFTAIWTANLTFDNPNTRLKAYFNPIRGLIYHEDETALQDDFLASTYFPPVFLDTKKSATVRATVSNGEPGQPMAPGWTIEAMKKERAETGTVSFSLRMIVWSSFKSDGSWASEKGLRVYCDRLKVVFDGKTGKGAVLLPTPLECIVYV